MDQTDRKKDKQNKQINKRPYYYKHIINRNREKCGTLLDLYTLSSLNTARLSNLHTSSSTTKKQMKIAKIKHKALLVEAIIKTY